MPILAYSFDFRAHTFCIFEPVTPFYKAKNYGMLMPVIGCTLTHSSDSLNICCRSAIHGRGLFCKRNIEAGEMVIEYAGIVIRSVLTDKREKYYDSKVGQVPVSLIAL